ncbi:hypothetical protein B1C81_00925 [Streptomyces sp. HG99]|nr:hypothetical protein B1C81_00925 [Streptomyces sp. HG99]
MDVYRWHRPVGGEAIHVRPEEPLVLESWDGVLAKTLPAPIDAAQRTGLRGARAVTSELPAPAAGAVHVERKVPAAGVIMVARQRLRVGRTYAGEIVTVHVEDTYFRITLNGADLSLHPRKNQHPITRFRAKIHAPKL